MNITAMTLDQLTNALKLAYKALGLLNKLKTSAYKTATKSRLFGLINKMRAKVKKLTK